MANINPATTFCRVSPRRAGLLLLLSVFFLFSGLPVKKAYSNHPCLVACGMTAPTSWALHQSIMMAGLAAMDEWIAYLMSQFQTALVKYANQGSNNLQNTLNSMSAMNDHVEASSFAADRASVTVDTALHISPSMTACATNQATTKMFGAMFGLISDSYLPNQVNSARFAMRIAENRFNGIFSNSNSTPAEMGRLSYTSDRYEMSRIPRYNNPATTGLTSTASIAPDADLTPVDTILAKVRFASMDEETAAEDTVLNLVGDAVEDSIRGNVLVRSDGRTQFMLRMQQNARFNLASTILSGTVERRKINNYNSQSIDYQNGKSELELSADSVAFVMSPNKAQEDGNAGARQTKSANLDTLIALMGDSSRELFVLQTYLEQWAAIKATSLAMDIKAHSARGAGVSARTLLQP